MKEGHKITIVVVDDHAIIRQGLTTLLQAEPDLSVIGEAADGEQAVDLILTLRPDVAIVNLHMPRGDGIQVIRRVRKSNSPTRLAVFTAQCDQKIIEEAFRSGASAYLFKDGGASQLIEAIHVIMDGGIYISPILGLLRRSEGEVAAALEAERKRIARELHDSVSQLLTGIRLNLELVERRLDSADVEALARLNKSKDMVALALHEIRRVSNALSAPDNAL